MPIKFLTHNKGIDYNIIDTQGLSNLPIQITQKEIIIVPNDTDYEKQIEALKAKFPNGKSSDVRSDFNGKLLFTVYEVSP